MMRRVIMAVCLFVVFMAMVALTPYVDDWAKDTALALDRPAGGVYEGRVRIREGAADWVGSTAAVTWLFLASVVLGLSVFVVLRWIAKWWGTSCSVPVHREPQGTPAPPPVGAKCGGGA